MGHCTECRNSDQERGTLAVTQGCRVMQHCFSLRVLLSRLADRLQKFL